MFCAFFVAPSYFAMSFFCSDLTYSNSVQFSSILIVSCFFWLREGVGLLSVLGRLGRLGLFEFRGRDALGFRVQGSGFRV